MNRCQYAPPVTEVNDSSARATRTYRSPVRDESARATRLRILEAAHPLFLERGYARCSITDIASAAGVARPTVLSVFGSKAGLLHEVVDVAMAGNDAPVPVPEQPWFAPVWAADDVPALVDAYAHACLVIWRRSARIIELVRRASDEGDELAALWAQLQRNRRHGAGTIAARAKELGPLRPGLTVQRAGDVLFLLNDSSHYLSLVAELGWSEKACERWLATSMLHALRG
jgi:AcrR family transcriptional regulator